MRISHLFGSLIIASSFLASERSAWAQEKGEIILESGTKPPALIELFSSEGCSSCPPAEAWLSDWKNRPQLWKEVVPVAFHVDYWDNLGWTDKFASPVYTDRQKNYAARWHSESVYTPEMVLNGQEWRGWRSISPGDSVTTAAGSDSAGKLRVKVLTDSSRTAEVTYSGKLQEGDQITVAWLGLGVKSSVRAGENNGRDLLHDFVVVDFETKAAGNQPLSFQGTGQTRPAEAKALAVWISDADGRVIQAVGGNL